MFYGFIKMVGKTYFAMKKIFKFGCNYFKRNDRKRGVLYNW